MACIGFKLGRSEVLEGWLCRAGEKAWIVLVSECGIAVVGARQPIEQRNAVADIFGAFAQLLSSPLYQFPTIKTYIGACP